MSDYARTIARLNDDYSGIGGRVGEPFLLRAAKRVSHNWMSHRPSPPSPLEKLSDIVRLHATEDDPLFPELLEGFVYEGATRAKLRIARSVLHGYPVRFWTANDELYGHSPEGTLGVFNTILMPLEWTWHGPFSCAYDTVISTSWDEWETGPSCGGGTSRVLGLAVIERLDVLSADPWCVCEVCGSWRPRECVVDTDAWMLSDPDMVDEYRGTVACRVQTSEGYCR